VVYGRRPALEGFAYQRTSFNRSAGEVRFIAVLLDAADQSIDPDVGFTS
jgi:hypothetical protein